MYRKIVIKRKSFCNFAAKTKEFYRFRRRKGRISEVFIDKLTQFPPMNESVVVA